MFMTSGIKKVCAFFLCLRIYLFKIINNSSSLSNEIRDRDDVWTSDLRPRQHVSGYFLICNFFFPDTASVHKHPANSTANPDIFKSAFQSGKKKSSTNPITCGRVNPDIFESDDVANSCSVSYQTTNH